jgi:FKBP-type peptidyl-prolyl cis-trans isomerase FkpA
MIKKLFVGVMLAAGLSGCLKGETGTTCRYDPCAAVAPASEIQEVQNYLAANNLTATQHCSGVFYIIDNPGNGKTPTVCSVVDVTYTGRLTNGNQFDAGTATFNLQQLIRGWVNTIPLIKAGGSIRLFLPPSMGYGSQSNGTIPANSILIFNITLNAVN